MDGHLRKANLSLRYNPIFIKTQELCLHKYTHNSGCAYIALIEYRQKSAGLPLEGKISDGGGGESFS